MKNFFLAFSIAILLGTFTFQKKTYGAVDQLLTDNFFLNPAELSLIQKAQLLAGNVFIKPKLKFTGVTTLGTGTAISKANDSLPYVLAAYRFSDKFVTGITATPSAYGHVNWPVNSIVSEISTKTTVFYYRIGSQSSYQFTDKLALGLGANLEYNKAAELNFVIPNQGNQVNRIHGLNYTGDLGLLYKLRARTFLTAALYSQVNTMGYGRSSLGITAVNNLALNITEATVASLGLQHWLNDRWFIEGKLYWSKWSIEKKVILLNTTTGSLISPTLWSNSWSFQILNRLTITDKLALLGSFTYETNPAPVFTNSIGYPLAPVSCLAVGGDLTLQKELSAQLFYSYGLFTPKAKINNQLSKGLIAGDFQGLVLQLSFKV